MRSPQSFLGLCLALLIGFGPGLAAQEGAGQGPKLQLAIEKELRERLSQEIVGPLDLDLIMLGEEFSGTKPSRVDFSLDGQTIYFQWRAPLTEDSQRYSCALDGSNLQALGKDAEPDLYSSLRWDTEREHGVLNADQLIHLVDLSGKKTALMPQLGGSRVRGLDGSGQHLVLQQGDNLYAYSLTTAELRQLTRIEANSSKKKIDDRETFLRDAETELLWHLHREKEKREEREAKAQAREKLVAMELKQGLSVSRHYYSPDLSRVLLVLSHRERGTRTKMPRYISADGYVGAFDARAKVGDDETRAELAWLDTATGAEIKLELKDALPFSDYSVGRVALSPDSSRAVLLLRARNNKTALILEVRRDGALRIVHLVEDEAWVHHVADDLGFLKDGRLWFTSELSDFNHLYVESAIGAEINQRTEGPWLIDDLEYRPDLDRFLLRTSRGSPHLRQIELVDPNAKPGAYERLFVGPGLVEAKLSPDATKLVLIYSESNEPHELYVRDRLADSSDLGQKVTASPSLAFQSRDWIKPEISSFSARDGVEVPFRLYQPKDLKPGGKAVVFVHGAGYLQNVHWGWSSYFREYLFHNLLVERGYVVIDVDYRGSAGYGRDWRCAIYRHMGGKDLSDQIDAASYLTETLGIDPKRIGIYGGSYGGFITLMALFTEPGVFQAGAALRPVTDWAHYNHDYTSNILNRPQDDPEAYRRSSPIHHAQGLEGELLICHGLEDDNVQPQDSIRLAQRLIELRKTGWELALYPVEAHGFRDPQSWADEYKRILKLFETSLGEAP